MPYLYRQAVLAHQEGIPLMRPMFVEFSENRACESLDKQYMLGDSLLVAPIFKATGEVEYYLPKGKWVNLLTNEVLQGGEWKKEQHDYFTMPLLVRPNMILPFGKNCLETEYDYQDEVTLYLSVFEENVEAKTEITDSKGNVIMTASAVREGDTIFLEVQGESTNWTWKLLGETQNKVVVR